VSKIPTPPPRQREPRQRDRKYLDTFRDMAACEACGKPNDGTIIPAHFGMQNFARGYKTHDYLVAGLCFECHEQADHADRETRMWLWLAVLRKLMRDRHERWRG
jgi:hypothetical protein